MICMQNSVYPYFRVFVHQSTSPAAAASSVGSDPVMHAFITDLPACLLSSVLCDWLDVKAIGRFDSAFCVRMQQRHCLTDLYESPGFVLKNTNDMSPHHWDWLLKKRIRVSHIDGHNRIDCDDINKYLKMNGRTVQSVTQHYTGDLKLAKYCRNIKRITFAVYKEGKYCSAILRNNTGIEELRLDSVADYLNGVALPKLRVFSIPYCSTVSVSITQFLRSIACLLTLQLNRGWFSTGIIAACLRCCPHLKSLGLRNCGLETEEMNAIATYCTHVVNLDLAENTYITDSDILQIVTQLTHLRSLCLDICTRVTDLGILYIAKHCANTLEVLHISEGLEFVLQATIDTLRQQCRKLHTFHYVFYADIHNYENTPFARPTHLKSSLRSEHYLFPGTKFYRDIQILTLECTAAVCLCRIGDNIREIKGMCPQLHTIIVNHGQCSETRKGRLKSFSIEGLVVVIQDRRVEEYDVLKMSF